MMTEEEAKAVLAEKWKGLGPVYFDAQIVAERFMEKFRSEHFKKLADDFADKFRDQLWGDIDSWLMEDTESNLQSSMQRMVEGAVAALLSGERWALERYVLLTSRYEGEKIRAAVAKLVPTEIQDKRIADLEAENADLKERLENARSRW
jgi:hypothetical protein